MNTLELAKLKDIEICDEIIRDGKEYQKEQDFIQWTDEYPDTDIICSDIKDKKGYVLKIDGLIAGYMCIDFDGEPAYNNIEGKWLSDEPYAVVHRMAFSKNFRGNGLTGITFKLIEELCRKNNMNSIRVDTDFLNEIMQYILKKNGFKKCGVIVFQGSEKLAYEKLL